MEHSVVLDYKRCRGCTTCIKTCPTEAIRVRRGKAMILSDRCIDCGRCIQVCPHRAIKPVSDSLDRLKQYTYCVAVPEPALYGQFHNLGNVDLILNGLLKVGFHKVFEAAKAAEILAEYVSQREKKSPRRAMPLISPQCPSILRLIRIRFPDLIEHLDPLVMPMELAATLARKEACADTGLPPEKIGVFAIVPCPAKVTAAHTPEGLDAPVLDGAFSIQDLYLRLLSPMEKLKDPLLPLMASGKLGMGVAIAGGESRSRQAQRYVAVDGIENCIQMLEEIEDGRQPEVDFIELSACTQGCVGGCMTVENPYIAKMRIQRMMEAVPAFTWPAEPEELDREITTFSRTPQYSPAFRLDPDRAEAMAKHLRIEAFEETLPGLHCGSCGAPNCHAFAEDVVQGRAKADDCIFKVRERMRKVAGPDGTDAYLPPPFRQKKPTQT